jgi:hypothetical protein
VVTTSTRRFDVSAVDGPATTSSAVEIDSIESVIRTALLILLIKKEFGLRQRQPGTVKSRGSLFGWISELKLIEADGNGAERKPHRPGPDRDHLASNPGRTRTVCLRTQFR